MGLFGLFRKKEKGFAERKEEIEKESIDKMKQLAEQAKEGLKELEEAVTFLSKERTQMKDAKAHEKIRDDFCQKALKGLSTDGHFSLSDNLRGESPDGDNSLGFEGFERLAGEMTKTVNSATKMSAKQIAYIRHYYPEGFSAFSRSHTKVTGSIEGINRVLGSKEVFWIRKLGENEKRTRELEYRIKKLDEEKLPEEMPLQESPEKDTGRSGESVIEGHISGDGREKSEQRVAKGDNLVGDISFEFPKGNNSSDILHGLRKEMEKEKSGISAAVLSPRRLLAKYSHASADKSAVRLYEEIIRYPFNTYYRDAEGVRKIVEEALRFAKEGKIDAEGNETRKAEELLERFSELKARKKRIGEIEKAIKEEQGKADQEERKRLEAAAGKAEAEKEAERIKKETAEAAAESKRMKEELRKLREETEKIKSEIRGG